MIRQFWYDEAGQDLVEYTLLTAFIAMAATSLFVSSGGELKRIWDKAKEFLILAKGQPAPDID